jgi:hypothetical protein
LISSVTFYSSGEESTYQLLQVPPADLHVPTVLIQALGKLLCIYLAALCSPAVGLSTIALRRNTVILDWLSSRSRGATAKETTNGMANRRTDCDTTIFAGVSIYFLVATEVRVLLTQRYWPSVQTNQGPEILAVAALEELEQELEQVGEQQWLLVGFVEVLAFEEQQLGVKGHGFRHQIFLDEAF